MWDIASSLFKNIKACQSLLFVEKMRRKKREYPLKHSEFQEKVI